MVDRPFASQRRHSRTTRAEQNSPSFSRPLATPKGPSPLTFDALRASLSLAMRVRNRLRQSLEDTQLSVGNCPAAPSRNCALPSIGCIYTNTTPAVHPSDESANYVLPNVTIRIEAPQARQIVLAGAGFCIPQPASRRSRCTPRRTRLSSIRERTAPKTTQ